MHGGEAMELWMKWSEKQTFERYRSAIDGNCAEDEFNLSTCTFPMRHVAKVPLTADELEHIEPILSHLTVIVCDGQQEHADYVLDWLAVPLQHLGRKTDTALLVMGSQGGFFVSSAVYSSSSHPATTASPALQAASYKMSSTLSSTSHGRSGSCLSTSFIISHSLATKGWCFVLSGTGKSLFFGELMRRIYGAYYKCFHTKVREKIEQCSSVAM